MLAPLICERFFSFRRFDLIEKRSSGGACCVAGSTITALLAGLLLSLVLSPGALAQAHDVRALPSNTHMFPNEVLAEVVGFQALYTYRPGDPDKPLIVFVPGDAHLARIAYGNPGSKPEDFLAHWVGRAGHPFLAVSYPLSNPVFTEVAPGYTIEDWGNQVATIAAKVVEDNSLRAPVIVAGWSMGGKIAASVGRAAKKHDLDIAMFVAMSADPPVPGFLPAANAAAIKLDSDGYANREPIYDWFLNAVAEQSAYNGHTIIAKEVYLADYLGNVPIDLIDTGTVYSGGKRVPDIAKALDTSSAFSFSDYPFPVLIHDNSLSDFENVLLDASDWSFIRNRVLIARYLGDKKPADLSPPQYEQLQLLVGTSQQFFTEAVEGTHFFFVGEIGARKTVEKILTLANRVESLPTAGSPN